MKGKRPQYPYKKKPTAIHLENAEKGKTAKGKSFSKASYVLFGALGTAALVAGSYIPFVRKVAFPFIATAVTKNASMLASRIHLPGMA